MSSQDKKSFSCVHCDRTFGRQDHLKRHIQGHGKGKILKCVVCDASFLRRDALLRHGSVHGERAVEVRRQLASQATRAAKACDNCAKSKQQCRGGFPCARCTKRNVLCRVEPSQSRFNYEEPGEGQRTGNNPDSTIGVLTSQESHHCEPEITLAEKNTPLHSGNDFRDTVPTDSYLPSPDTPAPEWYQHPLTEPNGIAQSDTDALNGTCISFGDEFLPHLNEPFTFGSSPLQWVHLDGMLFDDPLTYNPQQQAPLPLNHEILLGVGDSVDLSDHANLNSYESVAVSSKQLQFASPCFPDFLFSDHELLARDNFCELRNVSVEAYTRSQQFFDEGQVTAKSNFPSIEVFQSFGELYFEFFDKDFPCVHPQQIEGDSGGASWILLLAIASIGAQYSSLSNAEMYVKCFQSLLTSAIENNTPYCNSDITLELVQSILIRDINLSFCGIRSGQLKMEHGRNLLFTLQRGLHSSNNGSRQQIMLAAGSSQTEWLAWRKSETLTRTDYCINRFQSLQFLLFDLRPIAPFADMASQTLSAQPLWRSRNVVDWLSHRTDPQSGSESSTFVTQAIIAAAISLDRVQTTLKSSQESLLSRLGLVEFTNVEESTVTKATYGDYFRSNNSAIDNSIEKGLISDSNECSGPQGNHCSFHIMSILRHVNLRAVYAFSGWEADDRQVHEARTYLKRWIRNDAQSARKCLWNAASVFRTLRNKKCMSCFEVFYLLVATLVIWTYCMLGSGIEYLGHQLNSKSGEAVRLDKVEPSALSGWLKGESRTIHLAGLGVLEGSQGARRVLEELRRALLSGSEWAEVRRGIAHAVDQVICGNKAHLKETRYHEVGSGMS